MRIDKLFANGLMRLAACALMAFACAGDAWGVNTAPINPRFLEWQRKREGSMSEQNVQTNEASQSSRKRLLLKSGDGEGEQHILGYVPDLVDYSYLKDINFQGANKTGVLATETLPTSFDLRTANRVTSIKNQGNFGTCWAHATYASLESCLLSYGEGTFDFSEKHLAATHGRDLGYDDGGNATIAAAYLTRWNGPIAESEDPYPTGSWTVSPEGTPLGHVQNIRILTPMSTGYDTEEIKRVLYDVGAVYASYTHVNAALSNDNKNFYWNGDTSIYNPYYDGGHAVTIIGWDDNYSKYNFKYTPPYNGAFLVKNSWGANWGDKGCFWISYWDATFGGDELVCFNSLEPTDNYGDIYQHDPLGKVNSCSYDGKREVMYGANVFLSRKNDMLAAVGFYANAPNTKYTISVYVGCTASSPVSGTLALTQTGFAENCGYVTVPLNTLVLISKGQRFSIVFRLNTPGYNYPLAFEAYYSYTYNGKTYWTPTSEATASDGESFLSTDGKNWIDFTRLYPNGNLCFKAYTKSATASKPTLSSIAISGVSSLTSGQTATFTCEATYSDGSKKSVVPTWSITEGRNYATISSTGQVTAKSVTAQQRVTFKASYSEDGITKDATWGFYVTIAAPSAPTDVTATQGTETSCVRVNWTVPSGATEYAVYRATANNSKNAQYLENVTVARYNDTPAVPGVDYWYFIKAKNSSGTSGFSAGANGWRKLSPPENVIASDTLLDKVALEWNEVEGAKYYRVYRSEDIDADPAPVSGWQADRSFDDTTAVAGTIYCYYVVAAVDASGGRPSDYSIVEDGMRAVPVTVAKLEIDGAASIAAGANATYTATATYTDGSAKKVSPSWSIVSGSSYATVSGGKVTAKVVTSNQSIKLKASYSEDGKTVNGTKNIAVVAVTPSVPTGLTVTSQSAAGIALAWQVVSGAASYNIYRGTSPVGSASGTAFTDSTAAPGVTYSYSVSAVNSAGESAKSSAVSAAIPLSAPAGVTATNDRTDGVRVSWSAVNGATRYRVSRATSASGTKTDLGSWQTGTAYTDTSATAGIAYFYFVRAATSSSGANASGYSAPAQGMKKVAVTLSSIAISGPEKLSASNTAMYSCTATYSDGTSKTVTPVWSVSPSSAATVDVNGKLSAMAVAANVTATITAAFTDGTTKTASKNVKIVAPVKATAEVKNVRAATRWPFSPLLDIDYTLVVEPAGAKASVSVSGRDEDHGIDMAATALSGDGADGSYIAAGEHRLTWDVAADYPGFHAKAFSVAMTATPLMIGVPGDIVATCSTSGVTLNWSTVEDATGYEVWRGTGTTTNGATKIATVTGATTYFDGTGVAGTAYRYWLRASGEDGTGEFAKPTTGTRVVVVPTSLEISGADSAISGGSTNYICTVAYNDGTSSVVSPVWSITSGSGYATISSSGVLSSSPNTTASITIRASYTYNGVTKTATKSVYVQTKKVKVSFDYNIDAAEWTMFIWTRGKSSYIANTQYENGLLVPAIRSDYVGLTRYTFNGWWTAPEGGEQLYETSVIPESDVTVYAHWIPQTYKIMFDPNCGEGTMQEIEVAYDEVVTLPRCTYTYDGHEFLGWVTNAIAMISGKVYYGGDVGDVYWDVDWEKISYEDGQSVSNISRGGGENCVLYARWKPKLTKKYVIIDLANGTNEVPYKVTQTDLEPVGGYTNIEYLTSKIVMRRIEPGTFWMGDSSGDGMLSDMAWTNRDSSASSDGYYDRHKVTLTKPFYMGIYQMTVAQRMRLSYSLYHYYAELRAAFTNDIEFAAYNQGYGHIYWSAKSGSAPAVCFEDDGKGGYNWAMPRTLAYMIKSKTGISSFGVPTEAEWEYACRAGTTTAFNNGRDSMEIVTNSVMTKKGETLLLAYAKERKNSWGLYDMNCANSAEWTRDLIKYHLGTDAVVDPLVTIRDEFDGQRYTQDTGHVLRNGWGTPHRSSGQLKLARAIKSYERTTTRNWGQYYGVSYRPFCYTEEQ